MSKFYADRIIVAINGVEQLDVESMDFNINENLTRVDTMTRNRRSAGYRKGNAAIQLTPVFAVAQDQAQINLALKDPTQEVTVIAEQGGDRFTFTGIEQGELAATGRPGESTKTLTLQAIDYVDENGQSRLGDIGL